MQFNELMSILQAAVSPVILISGVGLLILSMTNRFGRVVDRSRQIGNALRNAPQQERKRLGSQIEILIQPFLQSCNSATDELENGYSNPENCYE